ncbi:MAG: GNAT family N-acetyltransferase [Solirubrobacterales bacterium]
MDGRRQTGRERRLLVEVADNPEESRYEIRVDGELAGRIDYRSRGSRVAMIHTEIDPAFEGRGLATQLISTALDEARERGLQVLPHCPFVRAYVARHAEYVELVPEAARERFGL